MPQHHFQKAKVLPLTLNLGIFHLRRYSQCKRRVFACVGHKTRCSQSCDLRRSTVITSQVPPVDWACDCLVMPRPLLLAPRPRRGRWW